MEIQDILKELEYLKDGVFPRKALEAAIAKKEEITPYLLDVLIHTNTAISEIHEDESYMAHFYALYLLAQFREIKAYPLIIDLFSLPGEKVAEITGDLITEDLHRILASVYDGNPEPLKKLVADKKVYSFTRIAIIETFLLLYVIDRISRSEVVAYYKLLLNGGLEREYSDVWDFLIISCGKLYPEELIEDMRQAYADDLVSPFIAGDLEDYERMLEKNREAVLEDLFTNKYYTLIDNTIKELQWWACFDGVKDKKKDNLWAPDAPFAAQTQTVINRPKVGRNAPCPCGSGRKYKKCCGQKD